MQRLTRLTFDLLTSPASSVLGTLAELLVCASVTSHQSEPVVAEVLAEFSRWERLGKITDHTHASSEKRLRPVGVLKDGVEKLEDGGHVRCHDLTCDWLIMQQLVKGGFCEHTLASRLHSDKRAGPGIHNTLTQAHHVIEHLKRVVGNMNGRSLLQDLRHDRQISLKSTTDSLGNVAKALKDCRLELVAESGTLQLC